MCCLMEKMVGILTEMSSEGTDISYVVVGIGINVYNRSFPEDIADKATSILLEMARAVTDHGSLHRCQMNLKSYMTNL